VMGAPIQIRVERDVLGATGAANLDQEGADLPVLLPAPTAARQAPPDATGQEDLAEVEDVAGARREQDGRSWKKQRREARWLAPRLLGAKSGAPGWTT
jgi:hypothetical protein